ncbi:hypothetical protein Cgig2_027262 [Carnegiea gigantea]|uniref:Uncharacterized protein n=1 Tax=Carnegiea gigantea TaxID=171969 RepID=A0A9Q1GHX6_9CARY|nr:hypothetical protein Cgig2_027262 [Carnegiea gigantea]
MQKNRRSQVSRPKVGASKHHSHNEKLYKILSGKLSPNSENKNHFPDEEVQVCQVKSHMKEIQQKLTADPANLKLLEAERDAPQSYKLKREHLLGTASPAIGEVDQCITAGPILRTSLADQLIKPVSGDEVKVALWSISGSKSPSRDGFKSKIFNNTWGIHGQILLMQHKTFSDPVRFLNC